MAKRANLRWSPEAAVDFAAIIEYIRKENPAAARRTAHSIHQSISVLAQFPRQGRAGRVAGTRELALTPLPFIVVYRINGDIVEVARVLHGSQRWP